MSHFWSNSISAFRLSGSTDIMVRVCLLFMAWGITTPLSMILATDKDNPEVNQKSPSPPKVAKLPPKPTLKFPLVMTPDQDAWTKAVVCIMDGRTNDLEKLLKSDPRLATLTIDEIKSTLLHQAGMYDHAEGVRLLLKYKADPTALTGGVDPVTPLHVAAQRDSVNAVKAFLEAGVDIDILAGGPHVGGVQPVFPVPVPRCSPLDLAAAAGSERVVELLLDHGAKLNVNPPETSYSALHRAMEGWYDFPGYGNLKRLEDPTLKAAPGNRKVIELLLDHGAKLNELDYYGNTPFHIAVYREDLHTVKYLLENHRDRIDVNSPGQFGCSPLQIAVDAMGPSHGAHTIDIIQLLLKYGADKSQLAGPSNPQTTAFEFAKERKASEDILELLRP